MTSVAIGIPFSHFSSLGGNKKWAPQYEDEEVGKIWEQNQLNRQQMAKVQKPLCLIPFCVNPFFSFSPLYRGKGVRITFSYVSPREMA